MEFVCCHELFERRYAVLLCTKTPFEAFVEAQPPAWFHYLKHRSGGCCLRFCWPSANPNDFDTGLEGGQSWPRKELQTDISSEGPKRWPTIDHLNGSPNPPVMSTTIKGRRFVEPTGKFPGLDPTRAVKLGDRVVCPFKNEGPLDLLQRFLNDHRQGTTLPGRRSGYHLPNMPARRGDPDGELDQSVREGDDRLVLQWAWDQYVTQGKTPEQIADALEACAARYLDGELQADPGAVGVLVALHAVVTGPRPDAMRMRGPGTPAFDVGLAHLSTRQFTRPRFVDRAWESLQPMMNAFLVSFVQVCHSAKSLVALLDIIKPSALWRIVSTMDGWDVPGFWALLELYGLAYKFDTSAVENVFGLFQELLSTIARLVIGLPTALKRLLVRMVPPLGHFLGPVSEGPLDFVNTDNTYPAVAALLLGLCVLMGIMPDRAATGYLRKLSLGITIATGLTSLGRLINDWIGRAQRRQTVSKLASDGLDVCLKSRDPVECSNDVKRRALALQGRQLLDQCTKLLANPDYTPLAGAIRTTLEAVRSVVQGLEMALAASTTANPPRIVVLVGQPGVGKTVLAKHLAEQYHQAVNYNGPPAYFDLQIDHHDSYSGAPAAIWDEFDTDPKALFVETLIAIGSGRPVTLNCDLPENKGRLFTSEFVVCTTNTESPVPYNHPRAEAFYRRVEIYDVYSPSIQRELVSRPGSKPVGYKSDFSHLEIWKRPHLGYDAAGNTLRGQGTSVKISHRDIVVVPNQGRRRPRSFHGRETTTIAQMPTSDGGGVKALVGCASLPIGDGVAPGATGSSIAGSCDTCNTDGVVGQEAMRAMPTLGHLVSRPMPSPPPPSSSDDESDYDTPAPEGSDVEDHLLARVGTTFGAPVRAGFTVTSGSVPVYVIATHQPNRVTSQLYRLKYATGGMFKVYYGTQHLTESGLARFKEEIATVIVVVSLAGLPSDTKVWCTAAYREQAPLITALVRDPNEALALDNPIPWHDVITQIYGVGIINTDKGLTYPVVVQDLGQVSGYVATKAFVRHISPMSIMHAPSLISGLVNVNMQQVRDVLTRCTFQPKPAASTFTTGSHVYSIYSTKNGCVINVSDQMPRCSVQGQDVSTPNVHTPAPAGSMFEWACSLLRAFCDVILKHVNEVVGVGMLVANMCATPGPRRNQARRYRGPMRGSVLDDTEYDEWQSARKRLQKNISVDEWVAAREGRAEDDTLRAYVDLMETRRNAGAWLVHEGPKATPELVHYHQGQKVATITHVGNGLHVALKHCFVHWPMPEGYSVVHQSGDVIFLKGPDTGPYTTVTSGAPERFRGVQVATYTTGSFAGDQAMITGFRYTLVEPVSTEEGDCGTPVYGKGGGLVGLHSGKMGPYKYAHVVTPSDVTIARRRMKEGLKTWKGLTVHPSPKPQGQLPDTSRYQATVEPIPPECTSEPALAGHGDSRQGPSQLLLLAQALQNYNEPSVPMDHDALRLAVGHAKTQIGTILQGRVVAPWSRKQAIGTLNMDSSCGPFVQGLKKDYLQDGNFTGELATYLQSRLDKMDAGQPIPHAYKLGLKDEMLPVSKAHTKKRLLWAADVALTVAVAQVFGPLFEDLKKHSPHGPFGPGMDADSRLTLEIIKRRSEGKRVVTGDFRRWDSTLPHALVHAGWEALFAFVEPTPLAAALWATLVSAPQGFFLDAVYVPQRGLPSGIPGTSFINSVCHLVLHGYCVTKALAKIGAPPPNLWTFDLLCYGDDFIAFWPPDSAGLEKFYHQEIVTLGMEITAADKSPFGKLEDLTFLKRTYARRTPGGELAWVAAPYLDDQSLLRQFCFAKGRSKVDPMQYQPVDSAERRAQLKLALAMATIQPSPQYQLMRDLWAQQINIPAPHDDEVTGIGLMLGRGGFEEYKLFADDPTVLHEFRIEGPPAPTMERSGDQPRVVASGSGDPTVIASDGATSTQATPVNAPPTGASQVAATTTGVVNPIDPFILTNFVLAHRFTWRLSDAPGRVLLTATLGPGMNPFTAHLYEMYGGWSGGFRVQMVMSGSGSFGGQLLVAIVPPNVPFIAGTTGGTGFPHTIVDVRNLAGTVFQLPDITTLAYHPVGGTEGVTRLVVSVLAPLINPFSTTQTTTNYGSSAEVLVFTAPAQDFTFHLLRPPSNLRTTILEALAAPTGWRDNRLGLPVTRLVFRDTFQQHNRHFDTYGNSYGWSDTDPANTFQWQVDSTGSGDSVNWKVVVLTGYENNGVLHDMWDVSFDVGNAPANVADVSGATCVGVQLTGNQGNSAWTAYTFMCVPGYATSGASNTVNNTHPVDQYWGTSSSEQPVLCYIQSTQATGNNTSSTPNLASGRLLSITNTGYSTGASGGVTNYAQSCLTRPILNGNYRQTTPFVPPGHLSLVTFCSLVHTQSSSSSTYIQASQPWNLSVLLQTGLNPLPEDQMAVFTCEDNQGNTWDLGLTSSGYLVTGRLPNNSQYSIPNSLRLTFRGVEQLSTQLRGPAGTSVASRMGTLSARHSDL
uniref:Genome polyprotein n=1 Tax=Caliciviridae sp. TaxID=1916234 RepID=A0A7D5U3J7_9CALI|nr:MAG: pol polyprotein [Caliciviridae sp.]